jgi:hypothetical protein
MLKDKFFKILFLLNFKINKIEKKRNNPISKSRNNKKFNTYDKK